MDRESSKFSFGDQTAAVFNSANSLWCDFRDWLSWPCEDSTVDTVTPAPPRAPTPPVTFTTTTNAFSESPVHVSKTEPTYVTNEYVTRPLEREILREVVIRDNNIDTSHFITRSDYDAQVSALLTSVEGSSSGASNALSDLSDSLAMSFTTDALTVSGSGSLSTLSVGTTSAYDIFTLDGMAYLAPVSAPTTTTNRLYNYDDNLYWSGNPIVGTLVGSWTSDGTHAWRPTGNVGIGTSSPSHLFTVAGDTNQTGALRFNGNAGTTGQILLSNGSSAPTWTATSSLGLAASFFQQNGNSFGTTATLGTNDANDLAFETSGTARVTILSSGNVGIGTTTPWGKLSIKGSGTGTGLAFAVADSADTLRFSVLDNGKIGIGTTTPQANLHIVQGGITDAILSIEQNTSGTNDSLLRFIIPTTANTWVMGTDNSDSDKFKIARNTVFDGTREYWTMDTSGNVGIGTTSPTVPFHIYKDQSGYSIAALIEDPSDPGAGGTSLQVKNTQGDVLLRRYGSSAVGALADSAALISSGGNMLVGASSGNSVQFFANDSYTTPHVTIATSGNVGIGTTSPAARLHVYDGYSGITTHNTSARLIVEDDTDAGIEIATPSSNVGYIRFADPTSTAVGGFSYDHATDKLLVRTASVDRMSVDSTGNVGIGTTSPAFKLDVNGTARFGDFTNGIDFGSGLMRFVGTAPHIYTSGYAAPLKINASAIYLNDASGGNVGIGTTSPAYKLDVNGTSVFRNIARFGSAADSGWLTWDQTTANTFNVGAQSGKALSLGSNGVADRIFINTSGNVGIGTTSPAAKLHVTGDILLDRAGSNDISRTLTIGGAKLGSGGEYARLDFRNYDSNGLATEYVGARISSQNTLGADVGDLRFWTMPLSGGSLTERMTILNGGNVGIGTTSPANLLDVAKDQTGLTLATVNNFNAAGRAGLSAVGESGNATAIQSVGSTNSAVTDWRSSGVLTTDWNTLTISAYQPSGIIRFQTGGATSATERMRITSTGNVGIGTTSPTAKLHIYGPITGDGQLNIQSSAGTGASATHLIEFNDSANSRQAYIYKEASSGNFDIANETSAGTANLIRFINNGTRMVIDRNGNVGIGTTTPGNKLVVSGSAFSATTGGDLFVTGSNVDGAGLTVDSSATGGRRYSLFSTADGSAAGGGKFSIFDNTGNGHRLVINSTGNVGIGTTSPSAKLAITGSGTGTGRAFAIANSSNVEKVSVLDNGNTLFSGQVGIGGTNSLALLSVYKNDSSADVSNEIGVFEQDGTGDVGLDFLLTGTQRWRLGIDNSDSDSFKLATGNSFTSNTVLTVDTSGNVGIGTTSPASKLTIGTGNAGFDDGYGAVWGSTSIKGYSAANVLAFNTNGSEAMRIINNGNVGIGTTSPGAKLDVNGEVRTNAYNGVTGYSSSSQIWKLFRKDNGYDKLSIQSNSGISFFTNDGTSPMMSLVSGNVGIGTTSPSQKLDVAGNIALSTGGYVYGDTTSQYLRLSNSAGSRLGYSTAYLGVGPSLGYSVGGTEWFRVNSSGGNASFGDSTPDGQLEVSINGLAVDPFLLSSDDDNDGDLFIVKSTGNVGIGTTSPTQRLTLGSGNILLPSASGNSSGSLFFAGDTSVGNNGLRLFSLDSAGGGFIDLKASDSSKGIVFRVDSNLGDTERMRITAAGNVGIGTVSPGGKIDINSGTLTVGVPVVSQYWSTTSSNYNLRMETLWTSNDGINQNFIQKYNGTDYNVLSFNRGNVGIGVTSPAYRLSVDAGANGSAAGVVFHSDTYGTLIESESTSTSHYVLNVKSGASSTLGSGGNSLLYVRNDGNVGIGTTSPTSKLSITQSAQTAAGGFRIATSDNADFRAMYMDSAGVFSFYGGDSAGTLNTATLNAAGEWTNASDRAYKERIEDLSYGLDVVMLLQPRSYVMRGTNQERIGFIAQEVELLLPELVSGEEGKKGISYGNMAAVIVKAIQDLYTFVLSQFKAQEQNNEEQEASIEALESRIRELEARQGISSPLEEAEEPDVDNSGVNTPIDLCLNLDGDQTEPPTGFVINEESGECLEGEPTDEDAEPVDVTPVPILGCTDEEALNYDIAALEDDGSCDYEVVETTPEITAE